MADETKNETFPLDFLKLNSPSGSEDVHYSLFYEGLPEEYELLAQKTLNETEENKQNGLKKLRKMMEKEKLTSCTDHEIISVLRCTKYNMKKAETKLKKYLKIRQNTIQLLASMDEQKVEWMLEDFAFGFLPYRDKHGRAIAFSRPSVRLDLYQVHDLQPLVYSTMLYIYSLPLTSVCGLAYIIENKTDDMYTYFACMKGYRHFITTFLDFPIRYGRVDIVNENALFRWIYTALRPIIPEKISKRILFHGKEYKALKNYYHSDILPEDFEGNLAPINNKYFRGRLLDFMKKLKAESEVTEFSNE